MSEVRKPWIFQEDQAIKALVKKIGTKKWSNISQLMVQKYGLSGRSGKQCRERWHNHLDPSINKKSWTAKQEKIIFDSHRKYGNKWTQIAQLLQGRTDNSIKNHFYSTLRRSLRRISKMLGSKNSTSQMRDIKPSVLSEIFFYAQLPQNQKNQQNKQLIDDCKCLSEALVQFAYIKPNTNSSISVTQKQRFESLLQRLLKFNENYIQIKTSRIKSHQKVQKKSLSSFQQNQMISQASQQDPINKCKQQFKRQFLDAEQEFSDNKKEQNYENNFEMLNTSNNYPFIIRSIQEIQNIQSLRIGINISPSIDTFRMRTPIGPTPISNWIFQFPIYEIKRNQDLLEITQNIRKNIQKKTDQLKQQINNL